MIKHLFRTTTNKPVCGAAVVKGDTITQAMYKDLCEDCLNWQKYRCAYYKVYKRWPDT